MRFGLIPLAAILAEQSHPGEEIVSRLPSAPGRTEGGALRGARTSQVRWRSRVLRRGVNPYLSVPASVARRLRPEGRGPIPVRFYLNGAPETVARINLVPAGGGSFYLFLNGSVRRRTRTDVGDVVVATVQFDRAYRGGPVHPLPPRFAAGLARDGRARRAWEALPPSRRKEIARYLATLKSSTSRARNVERALRVLAGERARFLGRAWNEPAVSTPAKPRRLRRGARRSSAPVRRDG